MIKICVKVWNSQGLILSIPLNGNFQKQSEATHNLERSYIETQVT